MDVILASGPPAIGKIGGNMAIAHNLGFPRIGADRELKRLTESYWQGACDRRQLLQGGQELRRRHWQLQREAGLSLITAGDFAWYDQVLNHSFMLGAVPERFRAGAAENIDTYFRMARGRAPTGEDARACEMTKWFDTNYHYIVPEFEPGQGFRLSHLGLFAEVEAARDTCGEAGEVKAALIGPLTYLWLGKGPDSGFDRLSLLPALLPVYASILERLAATGIGTVQVDEPILILDLPEPWRRAFRTAYEALSGCGTKLLLATYFGGLEDNLALALDLPVHGLHLDRVRGRDPLPEVLAGLGSERTLSLGVVDGRNIWRCDLRAVLRELDDLHRQLGDRLWLAPSCSLMHVPVDLERETGMEPELKSWLAFAVQKVREVASLTRCLNGDGDAADMRRALEESAAALAARGDSGRTRRPEVRERAAAVHDGMAQRQSPFSVRSRLQRERLRLPPFPTTTIGSFPQTAEIRVARRRHRDGEIGEAEYQDRMRGEISRNMALQEELGLDVLVHGEPERNDMVEYFGEALAGFAFSAHGWVQSYGSRCVKPPIVYGDVYRPKPITVAWIRHAQECTDKPVKGMLTGPATILRWSFARDDLECSEICRQIALALRDEVQDLERAGVGIIQIDEPAFREGLPLRRAQWQGYLDWAVQCFRLASSGVQDSTQIHTHMCYSEFNDIIESIARLDADVITIETARSDMELLEVFRDFDYPNEIGPGIYDIHSPRVPAREEFLALLQEAVRRIPPQRLWVNPDCGLKTRAWPETRAALANMVQAAVRLRGLSQDRKDGEAGSSPPDPAP